MFTFDKVLPEILILELSDVILATDTVLMLLRRVPDILMSEFAAVDAIVFV